MRSAAIFSLPGQSHWQYLSGEAIYTAFDKIEDFKTGFYAVPFDAAEALVYIPGIAKELHTDILKEKLEEIKGSLGLFTGTGIPAQENLLPRLENAISQLQKGIYEKLVIATCKLVEDAQIDPYASLQHLRKELPHTFICLMHDAKYGTWLSASPELFLSKEGNTFSSFALAGTKKRNEDFSEKEQEEQKIVSRYIGNALKENCEASHITMKDEVLAFGELKHLLTTIDFESGKTPALIAAALHPTPAVCGMPKLAAKEYLLAHEGFDRKLYSGFWGYVQDKQSLRFYVNLRTLQLFRQAMLSYAGAGITAQSDALKESEEIGQKMNSMIQRVQTSTY